MADSPEESAEFAETRVSLRRAQEELRRVEQIVTELTGLPSNWNGNVELHADEGVIEKLQRLLRSEVLARLGLEIPESVFAEEEAVHEFNPYLQALDNLYRLVQQPGESETDFYIALLGTPLGQRMAGVMDRGKTLPPAERATFLRAFAQASVILRNPPRP